MSDDLDEIWTLYADDGGQSLDAVEGALAQLSIDPGDSDAVGLLFRSMHTFKGNSRILGLSSSEMVAHVAEDLIGLVRDEGVSLDLDMQALLIEAADVLRHMMEDSVRTRQDAHIAAGASLVAKMKDKLALSRQAIAITPISAGHAPTEAATAAPTSDSENKDSFSEALVFEPNTGSLADDPVYRDIFRELTRTALDEIETAVRGAAPEARSIIADRIGQIGHAAQQIGMTDWTAAAEKSASDVTEGRDVAEIAAALEALYLQTHSLEPGSHAPGRGACGEVIATAQLASEAGDRSEAVNVGNLFIALLCGFGTTDEELSITFADPESPVAQLKTWAMRDGLLPLADLCDALAWTAPGSIERAGSLVAIGEAIGNLEADPSARALQALGQWCAERTHMMLPRLVSASVTPTALDWPTTIQSLMEFSAACRHLGWSTAREATLNLIDVCARARDTGAANDRILQHLLASFAGGACALIEAHHQDRDISVAPIEAHLRHTATTAECLYVAPKSADLHNVLDLPLSFQGVLSPESTQAATTALELGRAFFIVRADLEREPALTERFINWLDTPGVTSIGSVTHFEGDITKFDFLVATEGTDAELRQALNVIDPDERALKLTATVCRRSTAKTGETVSTQLPNSRPNSHLATVLGEALGEIAIVHSATSQMLSAFVEADIPITVDTILHNSQGDVLAARETIAELIGGWHDRMAQIAQAAMPIGLEFDRLQSIITSMRTLPASELVKPIALWATSRSNASGDAFELKLSGLEVAIEAPQFERLEHILKCLVAHCTERPVARPQTGRAYDNRIAIAVASTDRGVEITIADERQASEATTSRSLEDDIGRKNPSTLSVDSADLEALGAQLVERHTPSGGLVFTLTVPIASTIVDGMVVRAGSVRYVIPVLGIQRIVDSLQSNVQSVSAHGGSQILKLDDGDFVPVHFLRRPPHGTASPRETAARLLTEVDGDGFDDGANRGNRLFVIIGGRGDRMAIAIDELLGQQSVFVKPLRGYLSGSSTIIGCALLNSGDVGMVLDVGSFRKAA